VEDAGHAGLQLSSGLERRRVSAASQNSDPQNIFSINGANLLHQQGACSIKNFFKAALNYVA
jgi:hypothetical protein